MSHCSAAPQPAIRNPRPTASGAPSRPNASLVEYGRSWDNPRTEDPNANRGDPAAAAALLRQVLDAIEAGELAASSPRAVALVVRRLEGAVIALEEAAKT